MSQENRFRYPRVRMDALSDGIFSVAMTLLVLDVRLPENFHPTSNADLYKGLLDLSPKLLPYLLSFWVLGIRWLSSVQVRSKDEYMNQSYVRWWLCYLLLITCVPFTTIVVGRYASLAPAVWLYTANTALVALVSWRMLSLTEHIETEQHRADRRVGLIILLVSIAGCVVWSLFEPANALYALLLNLAVPSLQRMVAKKKGVAG
jgi:uncharacterized membrane protein